MIERKPFEYKTITEEKSGNESQMSIEKAILDLIPRPDSDSESEDSSESEPEDAFLPWTTNAIITLIDSDCESSSDSFDYSNIQSLTPREYSDYEADSEEDENSPDQESYKISEEIKESKKNKWY